MVVRTLLLTPRRIKDAIKASVLCGACFLGGRRGRGVSQLRGEGPFRSPGVCEVWRISGTVGNFFEAGGRAGNDQ